MDFRIESGHTLNDSALAVWGTQWMMNGRAVPVLVVEGENGAQRALTDSSSVPFGRVEVFRADDRFLVLWNDARSDGAGVRARFLGVDGGDLSDEFLAIPDFTMESRPISYTTGGVTTVVIEGAHVDSTGVYSVRLEQSGTVVVPVTRETGGRVVHIESFPRATGGLFIRTTSGVVLIESGGKIDRRDFPEGRFSRPFLFDGADGIVTSDSNGAMVRFARLDDRDPEWRIDSVTGNLPGRDSVGYFFRSYDHILGGEPHAITRSHTRYVRTLDSGVIPPPVVVDTLERVPLGCSLATYSASLTDQTIRTVGDGVIRLDTRLKGHATRFFRADQEIDRNIVFYTDSREAGSPDPWHIVIPKTTRTSLLDSSAFLLTLPSHDTMRTYRYSTTIASSIYNGSSGKPSLDLYGGIITAGGVRDDDRLFGVQMQVGSLTPDISHPTVSTGSVFLSRAARGWNVSGTMDTRRSIGWAPDPHDRNGKVMWATMDFGAWILRSEGWKRTVLFGDDFGGPMAAPVPLPPMGKYDPNGEYRYYLCTYDLPGPLHWYPSFITLSVTGENGDLVGPPLEHLLYIHTADFIPRDTTSILHFRTQDSMSVIGGGAKWTGSVPEKTVYQPIPDGATHVVRERLLGDRYVRLVSIPERDVLAVDLYDLEGAHLVAVELPLDSDTSAPFVAQNMRDSTLVIATQGASGTLGHIRGPELTVVVDGSGRPLQAVTLSDWRGVSTDLSVLFSGDTIYSIWSDYQSGMSDIYLNAVVLPADRSVDTALSSYLESDRIITEDGDPRRHLLSLDGASFTQSDVELSLSIGTSRDAVTQLDIFDLNGRHIHSSTLYVRTGHFTYTIPMSTVSGGHYVVRLSAGSVIDHLVVPIFNR